MIESVVVIGDKELIAALDRIADGKYRRPAFKAMGTQVIHVMQPYPPLSEANSPMNASGRWYERGYGPRSRTGWGRATSEHLGKSWFSTVADYSVLIGNKASYAPYVQGDEQAGFHGARGWKVLSVTVKNMMDDLIELIWKYIKQEWDK